MSGPKKQQLFPSFSSTASINVLLCSARSGVDCLGSEGSENGGVQHLGVDVAADDNLGGLNT